MVKQYNNKYTINQEVFIMTIYIHVFNIYVNKFHDPTILKHKHLLPLYYLISDHYASQLSSYVINIYTYHILLFITPEYANDAA